MDFCPSRQTNAICHVSLNKACASGKQSGPYQGMALQVGKFSRHDLQFAVENSGSPAEVLLSLQSVGYLHQHSALAPFIISSPDWGLKHLWLINF